MAMILAAGDRLAHFLDQLKERYSRWLPFHGKYIDALRAFILQNAERFKAEFDRFTGPGGDVHGLIDFIIDHARGNLALPWYLGPFQNVFLEAARQWLHLNADTLAGPIGELRQ